MHVNKYTYLSFIKIYLCILCVCVCIHEFICTTCVQVPLDARGHRNFSMMVRQLVCECSHQHYKHHRALVMDNDHRCLSAGGQINKHN